jgi:hypothetical protein
MQTGRKTVKQSVRQSLADIDPADQAFLAGKGSSFIERFTRYPLRLIDI